MQLLLPVIKVAVAPMELLVAAVLMELLVVLAHIELVTASMELVVVVAQNMANEQTANVIVCI